MNFNSRTRRIIASTIAVFIILSMVMSIALMAVR
jgi:hypothetical protein